MAKRKKKMAVNSRPQRIQTGQRVGSIHPTAGRLLPSSSIPGSASLFSTAGVTTSIGTTSGPNDMTLPVGIPLLGGTKKKKRGSS